MPKKYVDIVHAIEQARSDGYTEERVVMTEASLDEMFSDQNFTEKDHETHDEIGEFRLPVEAGDDNYLVTESGRRYPL